MPAGVKLSSDQKDRAVHARCPGEQQMRRQKMISITLLLSVVLLTIMSANVVAQQGRGLFVACDSGVYTLKNADQVLRVTIDWGDGAESPATVRFRQLGYLSRATSTGWPPKQRLTPSRSQPAKLPTLTSARASLAQFVESCTSAVPLETQSGRA